MPERRANPIWIGSANVGFILQLGNDNKFTVTLTGPNTYTGGTTILAGRLIIAGDEFAGRGPQPLQFGVQRQPDVRCRRRPDNVRRPYRRTTASFSTV